MAAKDKKQEFIFRSILPEIDIPSHLPLHLYCFQNKSRIKSRTCLIDESTGNTFTYADVELNAKKVAAGLLNLGGIGQGDVIMLLLSNLPEFAFALLGISYLGAISTTVNPCFSADEIFKQVESSRPKLIITEACYVEKVRKFAGIRVICTDSSPAGCLNFSDLKGDEIPATKIKSDDVAVIPYTSGTTGFPKGVMLTHKGLITNIAQQVDGENPNINITTNDVLICVLPMYHMYSMNCVLLCGIRAGATIVIMKKFEINKMLEVIQKYRVTIAHLVPPIVLSIDKSPVVGDYDLSSIRILMSGAAPLGKELERAVRAKLPNAKLGQGHGMTEGGPVISLSLSFAKEPVEMKSGSSGVVLRNAEMKIVDPNTGISLPPNQPGEVCVRGDNVMKGYLYDPEVPTTKMDNGWLQTGDFGYVDDDQELFIIERFKELIKYKEFQVAPAELEAILISHPNISDVAVVPLQDEAVGEVPVAFVVRATGSIITEDQVKQFVSEKVEVYKRINRVIFIDSIPKVASGKILRKELSGRLK